MSTDRHGKRAATGAHHDPEHPTQRMKPAVQLGDTSGAAQLHGHDAGHVGPHIPDGHLHDAGRGAAERFGEPPDVHVAPHSDSSHVAAGSDDSHAASASDVDRATQGHHGPTDSEIEQHSGDHLATVSIGADAHDAPHAPLHDQRVSRRVDRETAARVLDPYFRQALLLLTPPNRGALQYHLGEKGLHLPWEELGIPDDSMIPVVSNSAHSQRRNSAFEAVTKRVVRLLERDCEHQHRDDLVRREVLTLVKTRGLWWVLGGGDPREGTAE